MEIKKKKNEVFNSASPLTKFKIQKYYENETRFNGVFSRNNLPKKNKG